MTEHILSSIYSDILGGIEVNFNELKPVGKILKLGQDFQVKAIVHLLGGTAA